MIFLLSILNITQKVQPSNKFLMPTPVLDNLYIYQAFSLTKISCSFTHVLIQFDCGDYATCPIQDGVTFDQTKNPPIAPANQSNVRIGGCFITSDKKTATIKKIGNML